MLFSLSVLCVFPDNVDVTATSWGARRHTLAARARLAGDNGGEGGYLEGRGVTWTWVVYEIESETLSNYKNLREKWLDQIDDIYI